MLFGLKQVNAEISRIAPTKNTPDLNILGLLQNIGLVEIIKLQDGSYSHLAVFPEVAKLKELIDLDKILSFHLHSPKQLKDIEYLNKKGYLVNTDFWQEEAVRQALMEALPQLRGKLNFHSLSGSEILEKFLHSKKLFEQVEIYWSRAINVWSEINRGYTDISADYDAKNERHRDVSYHSFFNPNWDFSGVLGNSERCQNGSAVFVVQ